MSRASDVMGQSAPVWLSGRTYYPGDVVKSPADRYQTYVRITAAGSGATDPSADTTNYVPFGARANKSIQRGVITCPGTAMTGSATIAAVNTAKTELRRLGGVSGGDVTDEVRITLTNATTISATRNSQGTVSGVNSIGGDVSWELTEFY